MILYTIRKNLAFVLSKILFRLEIKGRENIPKVGGFILASNHTSFLDPVVIAASSPRYLSYMARHDLFDVLVGITPFFQSPCDVGVILRPSYPDRRRIAGIHVCPKAHMVNACDSYGMFDVVKDVIDGRQILKRPVPARIEMFKRNTKLQVFYLRHLPPPGASDGLKLSHGLVVVRRQEGEYEDNSDHSALFGQRTEHLIAHIAVVGIEHSAA